MNILLWKQCTKCRAWKTKDNFYKHPNTKDKLNSHCKSCVYEYVQSGRNADPNRSKNETRQWRLNNPEKTREFARKQRLKNPQNEYERLRRWQKNNPDKIAENNRNRRASRKGSDGSFTDGEWESLKQFYNYTCLCCKKREPQIRLTADHVLALIKGGGNGIENIQPLCKVTIYLTHISLLILQEHYNCFNLVKNT